jgi:hypothetical protein
MFFQNDEKNTSFLVFSINDETPRFVNLGLDNE